MKPKSTKNMIGPIVLVLGLLATAGWYFLLQPRLEDQMAAAETELEEARDTATLHASQNSMANRNLPEMRAQNQELRLEIERRNDRIPDSPEMTALMTELDELSDVYALDYRGIQESSRTQLVEGLYAIEYRVSVLGRFQDVVGFIGDLQELQRYVVVKTFDLSASGGDPSAPQINTQITFTAFVRGDLPVDETT